MEIILFTIVICCKYSSKHINDRLMNNSQTQNFEKNGHLIIKNYFNKKKIYELQRDILDLIEVIGKKKIKKIKSQDYSVLIGQQLIILQKKNRNLVSLLYEEIKNIPSFQSIYSDKKNIDLFKKLRAGSIPLIPSLSAGIRLDFPNERMYVAQPHQEFPAHPYSEDGIVFWSPLIKLKKDSGMPIIWKGSHLSKKIFKLEKAKRRAFYKAAISKKTLSLFDNFQLPTANIGDLVLFDFRLIHSSGRNISIYPRVTCQFRVYNSKNMNLKSKLYTTRKKIEKLRSLKSF